MTLYIIDVLKKILTLRIVDLMEGEDKKVMV